LRPLRFCFCHSFALVYASNAAQPLNDAPLNLGAIAVNVFFILSVIMLSRSYDLDPDWRQAECLSRTALLSQHLAGDVPHLLHALAKGCN
jgi:hypothetical protein